MSDIIKKVEAVLFAVGRAISIQELSDLTKESQNDLNVALHELKDQYVKRGSPLLVIQEGDAWKLTVHEQYLPIVQQISPHTELSKSVLETLAVIAWKQPSKQSDVIKIRTNKAYEHIDELERLGFVSKEKYGRTFLLKVTGKFFDYFDLRSDAAVREIFKNVKDVEEAQTKLVEHEGKIVDGLDTYGTKEEVELEKEGKPHVGSLEVFEDVESEKQSFEEESNEPKKEKEESENPIKDFIVQNKRPAPQEVEEGLAEDNAKEESPVEESPDSGQKEPEERNLDPELEEMVKTKKKK